MFISKKPISFYFLIIIVISFSAVCIAENVSILASTLYCLLIAGLFYYVFCRYSCIVSIENNILKIGYIFPWDKDVQIDLEIVTEFYYRRGFYGTFSGNSVVIGGINFCFDTIVLGLNNETTKSIIKVNTRMFSFDKIIKEIKKRGIPKYNEPFNKFF